MSQYENSKDFKKHASRYDGLNKTNGDFSNSDLCANSTQNAHENSSSRVNPFDMLKNIRFKFRWLPNNFVYDQETQNLCLMDSLQETVHGKRKPLLNKTLYNSHKKLESKRLMKEKNHNRSTIQRSLILGHARYLHI